MHDGAVFEAKLAAASQSNGQLMRTCPIGLFGYRLSDDEIATMCKADCSLSHIAPQCADAATVYCIAIAELIARRDSSDEALRAEQLS